jgi:hypothetical protein
MVMDKRNEHLEHLSEIRSLMERSSRFISLSGLSGVAAGMFALLGAAMVYIYLGLTPFAHKKMYYVVAESVDKWGMDYMTFFFLDAAIVLFLALLSGLFFSFRNAKRRGEKIAWDALSRRLLISMALPLIAGGIFCLGLIYHNVFGLVAPATLIFYGLACINASKYTLKDIGNLGMLEVALGLISLFNIGYGLEFWAIGFGLLHIIYGILMYYKYERT